MTTFLSKIAPRLVLGLASLLLVTLFLEIGLRILKRIPYAEPVTHGPAEGYVLRASHIPGLLFEMAPNRQALLQGVLVKTNRYGMRDEEPVPTNGDSVRRIAVVGDSFTFGLRVTAEQTYPKICEKVLNEARRNNGYRYNVLNFGVVEYSSQDEAALLQGKVMGLNPRFVIIGYVLNDPGPDPLPGFHRYFGKTHRWQHSYLLRLLAWAKRSWDIRRLAGGDEIRYLHVPQTSQWQSVVQAFEEIRDATSARRIKVLVVVFPMILGEYWSRPWSDYPYGAIHRQVAELAARKGFRVIDLLNVFSHTQHEPRELAFSSEDPHPTLLAHDLAARAIAGKVLAEESQIFGDAPPPSGR